MKPRVILRLFFSRNLGCEACAVQVTKTQQYALIEYISHIVNNDFARVAEDLVALGFVPEELVDPEKTAAVVPQLSRVLGQLVQGGGARNVNIAQVCHYLSPVDSR